MGQIPRLRDGRGGRGFVLRLPRRGRRRASLAGEPFHTPSTRAIDARLIGGSVIFGAGWGLVGLCPGPAIADIGFLDPRAGLFVLAMILGMALYSGFVAAPAPTPRAEAALDG